MRVKLLPYLNYIIYWNQSICIRSSVFAILSPWASGGTLRLKKRLLWFALGCLYEVGTVCSSRAVCPRTTQRRNLNR